MGSGSGPSYPPGFGGQLQNNQQNPFGNQPNPYGNQLGSPGIAGQPLYSSQQLAAIAAQIAHQRAILANQAQSLGLAQQLYGPNGEILQPTVVDAPPSSIQPEFSLDELNEAKQFISDMGEPKE